MAMPCPEPVGERGGEMMMVAAGLISVTRSVSSFHRLETGIPSSAHNIFGYIDRNGAAGVQRLLATKRGPIYDVRYAQNASPLFASAE